jgi:hypothetical protein
MFIDLQISAFQSLPHKCLGMHRCVILNTYEQVHRPQPQAPLSLEWPAGVGDS